MTTDPRRQAIEAAAKAMAKVAPRDGYDDVPLAEVFPTPRARYQFLHEHYMAAAEAAIDAYEAALWRPISEAPRDGTHLLCFHPKYDMILNGVWDGGHIDDFEMKDERLEYVKDFRPTHFRPLPAPPQDPETKLRYYVAAATSRCSHE